MYVSRLFIYVDYILICCVGLYCGILDDLI